MAKTGKNLKSAFSERDVCTKLITPALVGGGWNEASRAAILKGEG